MQELSVSARYPRCVENLHLTYRKSNPRRPVDWRWQLAEYLSTSGRDIPPTHLDDDLRVAFGFQQEIAECRDNDDRLKLLNRLPDFYEAWDMSQALDANHHRWEIEARLLARNSPQRISNCLGISERTVDIYESWFFNVRDRLEHSGYIAHQVLGQCVHRGLSTRDYDCLWKLMGYYRGSPDVDHMIEGYKALGECEEFTAGVRSVSKRALEVKAMIILQGMPIDAETRPLILDTWVKLLQMEQAADGGGGASQTMITNNLMYFLERIPWRKHLNEETAATADSDISQLRRQGVCIRAEDAMEGRISKDRFGMLSSAQFPQPALMLEANKD